MPVLSVDDEMFWESLNAHLASNNDWTTTQPNAKYVCGPLFYELYNIVQTISNADMHGKLIVSGWSLQSVSKFDDISEAKPMPSLFVHTYDRHSCKFHMRVGECQERGIVVL